MIRNVLSKFGFVRRTLAIAVVPILMAGSGLAQESTPSPAASEPTGATAEAERIIVTGSNIPTAQEVGPNPVLNINRDLIEKSGERTAEELIKNLPVSNGGGVPISNNATGFTPGASAISLRGLGPEATLVLIDGRRIAPYPIGNGGTSSFFDLRSIPEAAIESIEILKDGASTTYGADAIAGVVNIKMRKDYKGAEASIEYGNTLDKDSSEYRASLIFGVGDNNTTVTGVMNFYHRNSIFTKDRGYSAIPPFVSSNSTPENLQVSFDAVAAAGGGAAAAAAGFGPGDIFFAHAPFGSNGSSPASAYVYTVDRSSFFNFNLFAGSYPDIENYGGFVTVTHKLFGEQMVLYGDLYYQNATTHNELAAGATGDFQTPGSVTLAIPPNTPNPGGDATPTGLGGPTYAETGVTPGAFNPFNPFNQIIAGGSRARLLEFGNRLGDDETDGFMTTVGVRGDKLFDGTWGYDAGFRYSNVKETSASSQTSTSRFNRIINQADPVFGPGGALEGGVAFNPFGDALRGPSIATNAADVAYAVVHPKDVDTSELATLDFNIYTTQLFKLPAGGVGFAFGGQFRREQLTQDVDQINILADVPGNSPAASTNAGRKDYAFYAEADIPIFSPTFNFPGLYSLNLTAAVRYEAFENNDTNVAVPKFGIRWQPFDETLTVRATIGEGFREPSLIELYASPTSALEGASDILPGPNEGGFRPNLGGPPTPVRVVSSTDNTPAPNGQGIPNPARFEAEQGVVITSSPVLQPEDSRSFSGGVVYTPKYVPGLTLSVDVWDIERTGVVTQSQVDDVLQRELNGAGGTGQGLLPGEIVQRDVVGNIQRIFTPFVNSGSFKANGIDFGLQYTYPTSFGTFTSYTNASWLNSFQFASAPGAAEVELAGYTTDPFVTDDGYPKWKGVSRLDWAWNGIDIIGTVRYTGGFHERKPNGPIHYTKHTWVFDGQASYDFTFVAPVENQPVAGYSKDAKSLSTGKDGKATESAASQTSNYSLPIWKRVLNGTSVTIGCDNIFGQDPPDAYGFGGNGTGYPDFLYDSTGRFVYVQLTKKF